MRRLVSLFIILALSFSLFSCAKTPVEDDVIVDNLKIDVDAFPDSNPETSGEQNVEDNTDNTEKSEDSDEQSDFPDKEPEPTDPMPFTVDDKFSAYEIAVVLTDEETAKNKEYTVADFEGYDIFGIIDYNCYPEQYYPVYMDQRGFILLLNEPSKERVLEYCEKLRKDPRIEVAEPNVYPVALYSNRYVICAELTDFAVKNLGNMTFRFFDDIDFEYVEIRAGIDDICHFYMNDCDEKTYYENLKKLMGHKYIERAFPMYTYVDENHIYITITHERYIENPTFTTQDFPELENVKVWNISTPIEISYEYTEKGKVDVDKYCTLEILHVPTKKIFKIIENLKNNPIIQNVHNTPGMTIDRYGYEYKIRKADLVDNYTTDTVLVF